MYRASGLVPSYGIATGASDTATSAGRRRQTVLTCSLALPFIKSVVRIKQPANSATGRAACQHGKVSHRSLERGSRPDTAGSRETVGILQLPMPSAPFSRAMRTDSGAPTGSAPGENRGGEENASRLTVEGSRCFAPDRQPTYGFLLRLPEGALSRGMRRSRIVVCSLATRGLRTTQNGLVSRGPQRGP